MITPSTDKQTEKANLSQRFKNYIYKKKSLFTHPQVVLNPYDTVFQKKIQEKKFCTDHTFPCNCNELSPERLKKIKSTMNVVHIASALYCNF